MTPCLRPDEFIDLIGGSAGREALAHSETCPVCRAMLADVRAVLAEAEQAVVPEPSPLFWSQVNARVRAAIATAPQSAAASDWRAWLRFDVLVPLAGLAAIVMVLTTAIGRVPVTDRTSPAAATRRAADAAAGTTREPHLDDGAFALVLDLVASMPESDWDTLGFSALPDLGVAAQSLSPEEQQALRALLKAAVERPQS